VRQQAKDNAFCDACVNCLANAPTSEPISRQGQKAYLQRQSSVDGVVQGLDEFVEGPEDAGVVPHELPCAAHAAKELAVAPVLTLEEADEG